MSEKDSLSFGISVKDQFEYLDLNKFNPIIKQMICNFANKHENAKTIINLKTLLSFSNSFIQQPQNPWVLFRRNIAKKLKILDNEASEIASYLWKNKSEREFQFWNDLYKVIEKIYSEYIEKNERNQRLDDDNNVDCEILNLIDIYSIDPSFSYVDFNSC